MKKTLLCILFFMSPEGYSLSFAGLEKKMIRVSYYKNLFGHVHRNPMRYSSSMSTISCGHPVKVFKVVKKKGKKEEKIIFNKNWNLVKVGPYEGYIQKNYLVKRPPNCFQDRYPKFFNEMDLELSDLYFWGKLHDQYIYGKSKVK